MSGTLIYDLFFSLLNPFIHLQSEIYDLVDSKFYVRLIRSFFEIAPTALQIRFAIQSQFNLVFVFLCKLIHFLTFITILLRLLLRPLLLVRARLKHPH